MEAPKGLGRRPTSKPLVHEGRSDGTGGGPEKKCGAQPHFFYPYEQGEWAQRLSRGNGPLPENPRRLPIPPAPPGHTMNLFRKTGHSNGPLPENPRGLPIPPHPPAHDESPSRDGTYKTP